jgi:phenylacetate-coenzyme A ligase PaaK-like adenylate-forming protein
MLSPEKRSLVKVKKLIYTSEVLTCAQRTLIKSVLGSVNICSIMGSAEAGVWAVSSPHVVEMRADTSHADFVFDTRTMLIEIIDASFSHSDGADKPVGLAEGESGVMIQTSLSRLRNPLVRYNTGDLGSLHALPKHAEAFVPEADRKYMRVLRMEGRDRRFSFDWDGEYLDFGHFAALINKEESGILQWQIILDKMEPSLESSLEIRLLMSPRTEMLLSEDGIIQQLRTFVHAYEANEHRFRVTFVRNLNGFERSKTGRKVIKYVDRYNV